VGLIAIIMTVVHPTYRLHDQNAGHYFIKLI